jgi:hypothetical protein
MDIGWTYLGVLNMEAQLAFEMLWVLQPKMMVNVRNIKHQCRHKFTFDILMLQMVCIMFISPGTWPSIHNTYTIQQQCTVSDCTQFGMHMIFKITHDILKIDAVTPTFYMRLIFYNTFSVFKCFNFVTILIHTFTTEELQRCLKVAHLWFKIFYRHTHQWIDFNDIQSCALCVKNGLNF